MRDLSAKVGSHGAKLNIFAHSMGNVVVSHALWWLGRWGVGKVVHTYVATQGATMADAYVSGLVYPPEYAGYLGGANPIYHRIDRICDKFVNFYNPEDRAMNAWAWSHSSNGNEVRGFGLYYLHLGGRFWRKAGVDGKLEELTWAANMPEILAYCTNRVGSKVLGIAAIPYDINWDLNEHYKFDTEHSAQWTFNPTTLPRHGGIQQRSVSTGRRMASSSRRRFLACEARAAAFFRWSSRISAAIRVRRCVRSSSS